MTRSIRLAISTCPNDTFAFHALMHGLVDLRGLHYRVELLDIQQLNDLLFRREADILKVSFAAAISVADDYWVLPSGSALGFGVGPLLLAAKAGNRPATRSQVTLCPGQHTTAHHLYRHFYPEGPEVRHAVFSEIMPCLQQGQADFGVCIHEGRFTWKQQGLSLVEDLGTRWEQETCCPLPLGGILANRKLDTDIVRRVQATLLDSIRFALATPQSALPTMRRYAQEFDDEVLMKHVELYVNDWTIDLGQEGNHALQELSNRFGESQETSGSLAIFS